MTELYSPKDYMRDATLAIPELGDWLNRSALRLFLGAGVSKGFGLPDWKLLIARVLGRDADEDYLNSLDGKSPMDLASLVDDIDNGSEKYVHKIHEALYQEIAPSVVKQLQRSPLLLAVAAMMTGGQRGRVNSVVTYNYDDLLEQYLRMLGLRFCRRMDQTELSTRADVEINYVHGRLPQQWEWPVPVPIFSEKSYRLRRAEIDAGWSAFVEQGLFSHIGLFIGLSGEDSTILDILKRAQQKVQRKGKRNGFWILTPDSFNKNKKKILDVGMCPLSVHKDQIPDYVLAICQAAAA